jgi:DNA polymerase-3 subunit alpha
MLARGETFGVFQLESGGMTRYVQELRPESVKDLAAMVALYRPGPMQHIQTFINAKHGLNEVAYPHPDLAEVLDETHGVIVYQDQVLLIAQMFAGYSLGQADVMRKAMGKKIRKVMAAEEQRFMEGARAKGYTEEEARTIFELIEPFAGYAFNKAHAVSYAMIAYQTAYLKANYPAEYMTAVMMKAGQQRVAEAYAECGRLGIAVLPPDVNRGGVTFGLDETEEGQKAIRFGLASVKNVGEAIAEGIVEARVAGGPFETLDGFFERVPARFLTKRALECLVKAGAFDPLGERAALLASLDRLISYGQSLQKQRESGQTSLFDLMAAEDQPAVQGPSLENVREAPQQEKLEWEKELLGIYVSEHPFSPVAQELRDILTCSLAEVNGERTGDLIIGGIITDTRLLTTKDGRTFMAAEIEDQTGSVEITAWPDTYEQSPDIWLNGHIIVAAVRVRVREDRLNVSVNKALLYGEEGFDPALLMINSERADAARFGRRPNGNGNGANGGRSNGNGNGRKSPEPPSAVRNEPAGPEVQALRIMIEETEDAEADRERLIAVAAALAEHAGENPVRLAIRQHDGQLVEMEMPGAAPTPELTQRLGEIIGPWGRVGS